MKAALPYALRLSWRVLPVASMGKVPILRDWVNRASNDPVQIAHWAEEFPDANVGVAPDCEIFVLDVDPKNGGDEELAKLEAEFGELPATALQATPSGGKHFVFKAPAGGVSNSASKIAPGIDIRGKGGQFVVAPSKTEKGSYRWVRDPLRFPPVEAPAWLLALVHGAPSRPALSDRPSFPSATPEVRDAAWDRLVRLGPAIEGRGGETKTFAAAAVLMNDFALTEAEAWPLLETWNRSCQPPWDEEGLRQKLLNGRKHGKRPYGCERTRLERPCIRLTAGRLAENATEAEAALASLGLNIFSRGDTLVRPIVEEVDASHGRKAKVARLKTIEDTYLRDVLSRELRFERFDKRQGKEGAWVVIDPPGDLARTILARVGEWHFPSIAGVITTPTMRPDGSILGTPGFDSSTRLLLVDPPPMAPIPERPTREDALAALHMIEALFAEFPFVDEPSRSVALSAFVTAIARGAFPVAPAHVNTASTPGTGKSYLCDVDAAAVIGQPCPVIAAGRTEEETEKRIGAALLSAQPLINLDNLTTGFGGDALCQVIERPNVRIRILGRSELVRLESRATVLATGNNVLVLDDATRRVLLCSLDANLERPELRRFRTNPVASVMADRGAYVRAALIVVRAYAAAGRPDRAPPLGSFEGWSDTVRSALMWLGCADPCKTMDAARASDPILALMRSVFSSWGAHIGTGYAHRVTAAELLERAEFGDAAELKEAVSSAASNRGRSDTRTLGRWLSRYRHRIVNGLRLCSTSDVNGHSLQWWVEPASTAVERG